MESKTKSINMIDAYSNEKYFLNEVWNFMLSKKSINKQEKWNSKKYR